MSKYFSSPVMDVDPDSHDSLLIPATRPYLPAPTGSASGEVPLKSGPGMQLVKVAVRRGAESTDVFKVDTLEIQMLDEQGNILASGKKETPMTWAKPK